MIAVDDIVAVAAAVATVSDDASDILRQPLDFLIKLE
jgi:hypothetical protein